MKWFKDIHRSLYLKTEFRSFLPCSKQLALASTVTSLPLCHFSPTLNYKPWLPLLHQLKTVCDVTTLTQQSPTIAEQG
jgi:hypothetical protein